MGGQATLRVLAVGNDDVRDTLLARAGGGHALEAGLAEQARAKYPEVTVAVRYVPGGAGLGTAGAARLAEEPADVLLTSVEPSVGDDFDAARFTADLADLIQRVKAGSGAHVIVMNGSTVDPADRVTRYAGRPDPLAVRVNRANLALMDLSIREGISIVDVDRLIAELGGRDHVTAPMRYSPAACRVIGDEILRILEDIGFFERRPLVMQLGKRR
jgi:hypothetical protein